MKFMAHSSGRGSSSLVARHFEQTVASRDEAMAELVEIMEFLDQHESDSGRFD
jgi:hypothetical protein